MLVLLSGCASERRTGPPRSSGMERTARYVGERPDRAQIDEQGHDNEPVMYVDGRPITRGSVWSRLVEVSGDTVVDEMILDVRLASACRDAGIEIGEDAIAREESLFIETLAGTGVSTDSESARRILAQVREARGLGYERYGALLRRSAMLRALVADDVRVTDAAARLAHDLRYGPRRQARLITVSSSRDAQRATARLRAGEAFEIVATEMSTDVSASRGGLLAPMHAEDATYPAVIRRAMMELAVGGVSTPVALDRGFAIVKVVGDVPAPSGAPSFDVVADAMRSEARLVQERLLMSQLARELVEGAEVRVVDPGLRRVR